MPVQSRPGGHSIPTFNWPSNSYNANEFIRRFNDISCSAGLTSQEKCVKVWEYIDESLQPIISIIQTCSFNDWATFERMFCLAFHTESEGVEYVHYLIKTFHDKSSNLGIHIFLECFFSYTDRLFKTGLMTSGQRFSLLTFALPPSFLQYIRSYLSRSDEWLLGMPSDVPSSESKWAQLIDLTRRYASETDQFGREKYQPDTSKTHYNLKNPKIPYLDQDPEKPSSLSNSDISNSINSTPPEYLATLSRHIMRGQTSEESIENFARAQSAIHKPTEVRMVGWNKTASAPLAKNVSNMTGSSSKSEIFSTLMTSQTSGTEYTGITIPTRSTSPINVTDKNNSLPDNDFLSDIINEYDHTNSPLTPSSISKEKSAGRMSARERQVWSLFLKADHKVRSTMPQSNIIESDQKILDDDVYDIDDILEFHANNEDSESTSTLSNGSVDQPDIPVHSIMSQFMDFTLNAEQEQQLVEEYADILICYPLSEFLDYPDDILKHIFELVLQHIYSKPNSLSQT